jgi:hypothetical protein
LPPHFPSGARRLGITVFLVCAAACSRHFDVPTPDVNGPVGAPLPPAEPATIVLPVFISTATLRARLDSVFPETDSLDRAKCSALGGFVCHQYVYRRDALDVVMLGDRIILFTRLGFRARMALPGVGGIASCGYEPQTMRRAELRLATSLYWRTDWRLASKATVLEPSILDPCQVTVLHVDATPTMRRLIDGQLAHLRQELDSIIPAIADLKPAADSMWRTMQRPFAIDSASTAWLVMSPEAVSLAPLTGSGTSINTAVVLRARPRVVVGAKPVADFKPLPSLTLATPASGIHVPIEIRVSFDDLSKRMTALLGGEIAGKGIRVGDISVWGVGDTAIVKVAIEGRMTGSLFLLGRVGYDATARTVLINDLRYTIASSTKMTSIKATLGAIRIRHALDEATGHGRLAIGEQLDRVKAQFTTQLNRELAPGLVLSGGVTDVRIGGLYTTGNAFVVRVTFDGDARLDVK